MKMNVLLICIGIILGATGMGVYDFNKPPKTQIINQTTIQNVDTKTSSIQQVDQSQNMIQLLPPNGTNFKYVQWQGQGKTNNYTFKSSTTNNKSKTNKR